MQKFVYIAGQYNQIVKFYNVEQLFADKILQFRTLCPQASVHYASVGALYRFMAMNLTEIDKVIYLDSDTVVNLDIAEIWQIDLNDKILGVISEKENGIPSKNFFGLCLDGTVKDDDYFNSGVLLMNLKMLRLEDENIINGFKVVAKNSKYTFLDQDILNYCFSTRTLKLPIRFNRLVASAKSSGENIVDSKIYHYNGDSLKLDFNNALNRLFMGYFIKTPWFNEEAIKHLYEGTRQIYIEQKNFATQISALISGKSRAFLIASPNVDVFKRIFYVKEDEEFIAATSPESLQQMIRSLKKSNGKKVFFILAQEYLAVRQILMQEGFIEGKDFVNAAMFLSDAHGVPFNSYPLVKLL